MADAARVALLARPGEACERLRAALREAGGEIVLEADPSTLAADALIAAAPQAVLVALDPAVEDALDRFDAVLGDPGVAVIFDEAELAARREGWDAARWVRHLSAKLHRHGDVLPPGREPDEHDPGEHALDEHAPDEHLPDAAVSSASASDRDTAGNASAASVPTRGAAPAQDVNAPVSAGSMSEGMSFEPQSSDALAFDATTFEVVDGLPGLALEAAPDIAFDFAPQVPGAKGADDDDRLAPETPLAFAGLELTDDIDAMSLEGEAPSRNFDGALEFDALLAGLGSDDDTHIDARERTPNEASSSSAAFEADAVPQKTRIDDDRDGPAADNALGSAEPAPAPAPAPAQATAAKPSFDFGELSLVDETDAPATGAGSAPVGAGRFQHDIADLERRIASMGLSDGPEAAPKPAQADIEPALVPAPARAAIARGAVLILAGIGGPDAVRQILSGLPTGFARPVLISQRLDGGRYDRLVQQMGRAASLPVQLAQAGTSAEAGHIYIVPPELGLDTSDGLRFSTATPLLASLPADESAVLLLSGADPAQVDGALEKASQGALVAGQSPEGCYDAAAPIALTTRGGTAGTPPELVQRLLQRWPV